MSEYLNEEIRKLKENKNAIILAHYYQVPEIQDAADFIGDSFELSRRAKENDADLIIFCGVRFMAESAKILSPHKKVLLPVKEAGCPMADMATAKQIVDMKREYPNAKVVTYVNSSVEAKAVSDVCCTSSNAINIVKNIDADEIIFAPDKNLGSYIQENVPEKKIILWKGHCCVHDRISKEDVLRGKEQCSTAKVLVHPECRKEVRDLADYIGSTSGIINYARESKYDKFLIVTEEGVLHKLKKENPNKQFFSLRGMTCKNMKKTSLDNVYWSLDEDYYEINIDEEIRKKAANALENMLILGK
ncbi:quinolinate synthase A [Clostridium pasteurianum DSM 525 = ATCC 6013]|uniref:Quinolinate synthase n=1 Tax=Clostridium pasteurianum DSM 525 = ATCC 6013 TaxID=1262449 RepID=A0A0H3J0X2_CLOPA|nr:quinolinate synthase NadA [Clostridium pasteurianum]AJA46332.1 quinolinate synthase A [Clostridium pasteurianum DSM 525 = ATCC 6013]AJA50320.1 quinolinate synthase A [Clostridium pasteurianum DSM 525 = ATCC 6013]AOZ73774.1 quinolinate synthetase [Clostridium pasteurianum DSM 525 = ATCC 6013]AOZ77571.1 quinolinate synthetase [Clostridium pasteurianum]ELP60909.1 quinolinate synthetase [Clostridium pasteurianum DSM 525 = ATCC 6013]